MDNPEQLPATIGNLGDILKAIEKETGQASQLVVKVGDVSYLVGDLSKREGDYIVEMDARYKPDPFEESTIENPYMDLAGSYDSFDALEKAVDAINPHTEKDIEDFHRSVHLVGNPKVGYSICVPESNLGAGGGQTYTRIGRVISPTLQDDEVVPIDKVL